MTMRDGMPLHAAMVEKDGYGVVFLGPSGMGKSTQAKLWVEHQGADFIIGDRPGLRRIDGQWIGFGMPWDGKDGIKQQKQVPIRALISLEQASENSIRRLTKQEAMNVLLNQVMMPIAHVGRCRHGAAHPPDGPARHRDTLLSSEEPAQQGGYRSDTQDYL